jgi:hypothetical protein
MAALGLSPGPTAFQSDENLARAVMPEGVASRPR